MIKKLGLIGALTGSSHVISILTLIILSRIVEKGVIGQIGLIESKVLLITNLIAFGLQLATTRNIAVESNWKAIYSKAQSGRLTLSFAIFLFGLVIYLWENNLNYLVFLISPLIALNGDYALYGVGQPVKGSVVAFVRVFIPSLFLLLVSSIKPDKIIEVFILGLGIAHLLAGYLTSVFLGEKFMHKVKFSSLLQYVANFKLGLSSLGMLVLNSGYIVVLGIYYGEDIIGEFFLLFKLYIIFKGVRRLIVQAFFKDLLKSQINLEIDKLSLIAGFIFMFWLSIYPQAFVNLVYSEMNFDNLLFVKILGATGLISSSFTSAGTLLLLNKNDRIYFIGILISSVVTMVCTSIGYYLGLSDLLFFSIWLFLGEVTLIIIYVFNIKSQGYIKNRFKNFAGIFLAIFISLFVNYIFGDSVIIASLNFLGIAVMFTHIYFNNKWFYFINKLKKEKAK